MYTTNNGTTWLPLGATSDNNARLLAADAITRLYYQPNANFNGTITNALTFRAWDQTSGINGSTADTSANGGATAFSTGINSATLTINPVNDAPILTDTNLVLTAINEDVGEPIGTVGTLVSSLLSLGVNVTDPDNDPLTGNPLLTGIAITNADTTNGNWFYSPDDGGSWAPLDLVSNTNARLLASDGTTRIYFQPK
ncbi:MAG: hypothetical protein F6K28_00120, partial [Microcoleus sp. SIO2G3]|nr:hypothetical protein [Microcoleus sp. SIO2G3]